MTHTHVAAVVGDRTLTEAEVEARVAALRSGPLAPRLPRPGTADARNLRRWVVQVMTYEAVVEQEAATLDLRPQPPDTHVELRLTDALRMGGVTAAVLTSLPVAPRYAPGSPPTSPYRSPPSATTTPATATCTPARTKRSAPPSRTNSTRQRPTATSHCGWNAATRNR